MTKSRRRHTHLRRRQAAPGGGVHRLEHVGDEQAERLVDLAHRAAGRREPGIGPADDGQDAHARAFSRLSFTILRVISWRLQRA